jgi:hypothetical protein
MFKSIKLKIQRDKDYPERQFDIDVLTRVLKGSFYDHLEYDFHQEKKDGIGEYIPVRERRPSVRYALCRVVVDDSVSLLFSEGHFPEIDCKDETTREVLADIIKEAKLNQVMIDAATTGSVGSAAILLRVLKGRIFFKVFNTQFMTPVWQAEAPDTLDKVIEQYKVKGPVLIAIGYVGIEKDADYWFKREWDATQEIWYTPWNVADEKPAITVDTKKTTSHGLGFVPMVWIKNLPGGDDIDGECTFPTEAIDTQIEIDYQLSQAGRGLKYSADPTLLLKEPAMGDDGSMVKGGGNAIVVGKDGDAKMLEINGTAAAAVIEYVRALRELALESAHGNRSNADKISAAQSGRAMELMNQQLIWLADKLRISYGEGALLSLLNMVKKASAKFSLSVNGKTVKAMQESEPIALKWPAWYAPTYTDIQAMATALDMLVLTGILSRESAIKKIADYFDIEDTVAEKALIDADRKEQATMQAKAAAAEKSVPDSDPSGAE